MVNRSRDRGLYDAWLRRFSSWRIALTASSIHLDNVTRHRPRQLDHESMILWLRKCNASGQTLVYTEICPENRDYELAIKREFGS